MADDGYDEKRERAREDERAQWVRDAKTKAPLPPRAQPGYYPGYKTLEQADFWDEATRKVVLERVEKIPPIRFFSPAERRTMEAICARLLPQDDRDEAHRIPIVPHIDDRLTAGRSDGYRYEAMPNDAEAYRLGLEGIDALARELRGCPFVELGTFDQDLVLKSLHDGEPLRPVAIWKKMPPERFFMMMMRDAIDVYYAHPYAWDEIGYGGPAYPRGYMRLENGDPEPWEKHERRYAWEPPESSLSTEYEPIASDKHHATPGQGGTH